MRVRWIAWLGCGLLPCCWASFPEERLSQDASVPRDLSAKDRSNRDQPPPDRNLTPGDRGDLTPSVDRPRPDIRPDINLTCNPTDPPRCETQRLVTCSALGRTEITPCPLGCEAGECCVDVDRDQSARCKVSGGDCDDTDGRVFPGQTAFFTDSRAIGTYDYNCDAQDEPQYPDQVACQKNGGDCVGDGWSGPIPACGEEGDFVRCVKDSGQCVPDDSNSRRQACR